MLLKERLKTISEICENPANKGHRARATVDYFRWNFGHRTLETEYLLPLVNDARMIVSNRQNYATLVYTCRLWDFPEQAFLLHMLRPTDVFADIGANVGGYTILASAVVGAKSISFEPVPVTFDELRRNIRLNNIDNLVEAHCCALGEVSGHGMMTSDRGGLNHMVVDGTTTGSSLQVVTDRLDDVLGGRACRAMKMDAEGFEMKILRGAPATLSSPELSALVVELNGSGERYGVSNADLHEAVTAYDFRAYRYDAVRRRLEPLPSFNSNGLNTLYIKDLPTVSELVATGPRFRLRDMSF